MRIHSVIGRQMDTEMLALLLTVTLSGGLIGGEDIGIATEPGNHRLRYHQPATRWTEALPLGNGRLGAMVFGTAPSERRQLNEESLWAGEPADPYPEDAVRHWRELQKLVLQ